MRNDGSFMDKADDIGFMFQRIQAREDLVGFVHVAPLAGFVCRNS